MIAHVIDGERAPPEYHMAIVCEQFGLDALRGDYDTRTLLRMSDCLGLAEGLGIIRRHMMGELKDLPASLMPLAEDVMRYKYRSIGQEYPHDRLTPGRRRVQRVADILRHGSGEAIFT